MKRGFTKTMTGHLLVATMLGLAATPAVAQQTGVIEVMQPWWEMTVVLDRAEGDSIAAGNHERAIVRIPKHGGRIPFENHTNLCVAYTMIGQFEHARHHCDEAVDAAAVQAQNGRRDDRDYPGRWAVALSNRGVLKAMLGDARAARVDFAAAIDLGSDSESPVHNLAFMNGEPHTMVAGR